MQDSGGKSTTFLISIIAFFLLSACGQDGGQEQVTLPLQSIKGEFSVGRCSHQPSDGDDMVAAEFKGQTKATGYFGKKLNLIPFNASLTKSSLSIVENLQARGVYLYQIDTQNLSPCSYFDFLHPAPESFTSQWYELSPAGSQSALLGLFTTFYNRGQDNSVYISSPTIILRRDTQKWTLIHEMSHYLFAQARTEQKNWKFRSELEESVRITHDRIKKQKRLFRDDPTQEAGTKLLKLYQRFYRLNLTLDKRGPLEEFTIEAMMLRKAEQGEISHVDEETEIKNAFAYMATNANLVSPSYRRLIEELEKIETETFDSVHRTKGRLIRQIQRNVNFIDENLEYAENLVPIQTNLSGIGLGQLSNHSHGPSHHSNTGDHHHFDLNQHLDRQKLYYEWD